MTYRVSLLATAVALSGCGRLHNLIHNKTVSADGTQMLVLGDSLSTGVFTSDKFWLNYGGIVSAAVKGSKISDDSPRGQKNQPVRLRKPEEEVSMFGGASKEAAAALLRVIEWPELSWGSRLASDQQVEQDTLVIAARNGATSTRAPDEVSAWLGAIKGNKRPVLPRQVFLLFSGDDLCQGEKEQDHYTPVADFQRALEQAVLDLSLGADSNPAGTEVYLVSHLNILQMAESPTLLASKTIHVTDAVGNRHISCLDFIKEFEQNRRATPPVADIVSFTYNPMHMCYNVLAHAPGLDPSLAQVPLATLAQVVAGYRQGLKSAAANLAARAEIQAAHMQLHVITTTEELTEEPDDIANDCFHLSSKGQEKLQRAIRAGM